MITSKRVSEEAKKDPNFWITILQRVYGDEDGKMALLWLMEQAQFFTSLPDPILEAKNGGKRELVGNLLEILKVDLSDISIEEEAMDVLDNILEE